jgi:hypothetical protein
MNSAYETHVRKVQSCDLMMKKTTSDTNPIPNKGAGRPVVCQKHYENQEMLAFKARKAD